jgi:hypothetical protein
MKLVFSPTALLALLLIVLTGCAGPGLEHYRKFVVADKSKPILHRPTKGVRVTYVGVNGYLMESANATVLVDPYFTRIPPLTYLTSHHLQPNKVRIEWAMKQLPQHIDLILVTHAHPDHIYEQVGCIGLLPPVDNAVNRA